MDWFLYLSLFVSACGLLYVSGEIIIDHLVRLSRYFGLAEFVVAFLVVATAASLPNLFIGVSSALRGVPELSLGDVFGNNLVTMTLAVAAAIFFSAGKTIRAEGKTIQTTVLAAAGFSVLPLVLMADGVLSRLDGVILVAAFAGYIAWLFSKKDRFSKSLGGSDEMQPVGVVLKQSLASLVLVLLGMGGLVLAAQGIVTAAEFFALSLGFSLILIGVLVVGLGNALPQVYFAVASARRGESSIILGNLMGATIMPATLVLGLVSIIDPVPVDNLDLFSISRFFLILAAAMFLLTIKTEHKLVLWEGWVLLFIYLAFLASVLFVI